MSQRRRWFILAVLALARGARGRGNGGVGDQGERGAIGARGDGWGAKYRLAGVTGGYTKAAAAPVVVHELVGDGEPKSGAHSSRLYVEYACEDLELELLSSDEVHGPYAEDSRPELLTSRSTERRRNGR